MFDVRHTLEVGLGGGAVQGGVLHLVLLTQIIQGLDGGVQT